MYNRIVLVCTVNVHSYIPACLGRRPIPRYQVLKVRKNCTYFTYSLKTDSYVSCREYCQQFEINTARHLMSAVFIARHFKYRKQKTQPYSLRTDSYVSCGEYCKKFEINTARHLLSAVFIARHFKYRKQKTQQHTVWNFIFLQLCLGGI